MKKYTALLYGILPIIIAYMLTIWLIPIHNLFAFPSALEYGVLLGAIASLVGFSFIVKVGMENSNLLAIMFLGTFFRFLLLGIWSLILYQIFPKQLTAGLLGYAGSILLFIFYEVFYLIKNATISNLTKK